jgi:hypothetical protein
MTKIKQSDFIGDTITKVEKPKSYMQKLREFRNENEEAYLKACDARCVCSPSRAEALLIEKYEGVTPID